MLQISLSGTGGQGLILAGIILAEAAIIDGKQAIQTQSYGPEARGGASKAEVIISNDPIDYPKVLNADILLVMSQEACNKYSGLVGPGGRMIVDTSLVWEIPEIAATVIPLEITRMATEELGKVMVANIIALGALVGLTQAVSQEALKTAVLARVPKGTEELNQKALEIGFNMVKGLANA
ncbi:MAG: 2-oxoacid:acceptor oxidoreductase family protein [Sporomusaceae bacterium]|nr:2-oxoacid:acceptor oxidoreductase family protein [Sporomusaceae bacterium]